MNSGWIRLDRKIREHWIFEHPDMLRAWIDLLMWANWDDRTKVYKMKKYEIKKGDVCASYDLMSRKWNMSIGKVRRFIKLLQNDKMIDIDTSYGFTLIKIVNYAQYQTNGNKQTDKQIDKQIDKQTDIQIDNTIRSITNKQINNNNRDVENIPLLTYFGKSFERQTGIPYNANFGKDGKILKDLKKHYSYDDVILGIDYFFNTYIDRNPFAKKNPSVGGLKTVWNGMMVEMVEMVKQRNELSEWEHE